MRPPRQFKVRWYMKMNLREIFHMVELRSGPQGHPDYRKIAQSIYHEVQKNTSSFSIRDFIC
ncbi:MAG: hypothetical protein CM1200mP38_6540 [Dehalococcoidia bacterium]|nr:MAG: hypothetical protein CM1200mP38_6540 [Dehalococcoidia bacterium]